MPRNPLGQYARRACFFYEYLTARTLSFPGVAAGKFRLAHERVKQIIEGPDVDIDRIVRSARDSGGKLSGKLADEIPALADEQLDLQIAAAVKSVLPPGQEG